MPKMCYKCFSKFDSSTKKKRRFKKRKSKLGTPKKCALQNRGRSDKNLG